MNLSDQVVSLELAKKLKKLGVKQESIFYWENCNYFGNGDELVIVYADLHDQIVWEFGHCHSLHDSEKYSAFTVAELGLLIPIAVNCNGIFYKIDFFKNIENEWCYIYFGYQDYPEIIINEPKEADARAKMLIWLIEQGHVKL